MSIPGRNYILGRHDKSGVFMSTLDSLSLKSQRNNLLSYKQTRLLESLEDQEFIFPVTAYLTQDRFKWGKSAGDEPTRVS